MGNYTKFHRNNYPIEIHYTLIKDCNDGDGELDKLYNIVKENKIPLKFIRFNPKDDMKVSEKEEAWVNRLREIENAVIKTYSPPGKEIGSSCGEFTKHYYHEEIESEEDKKTFLDWKQKHEIFD